MLCVVVYGHFDNQDDPQPMKPKKLDKPSRRGRRIIPEGQEAAEFDPSKPLDNQQHEAFAILISQGKNNTAAYSEVYGATGDAAQANASRLIGKDIVSARVQWLKAQTATANVLSAIERREFMTRVKRVNLAAFDMEKDGDLLQEIIRTTAPDGTVMLKVKLPGKRECIMADAELAGDLKAIERGLTVNVGVTVEVLTESERSSLIDQKRQATERRLAARN